MSEKRNGRGLALVAELVNVLANHGELRCAPTIEANEEADGSFALTVRFYADAADEGLDLLALQDEVRYVADVAQMRAFAHQYGIDPAALEELLPLRMLPDGARPEQRPSPAEWAAVIKALEDEHLLPDTPEQADLIWAALPKLRAMCAAEVF
jgi:hypothetical protein